LVDYRWSDLNLYSFLAKNIIAGQVPYFDFQFEYPPLSLIFIVLPGVAAKLIGNFDTPYRLIMMLFDIGCLLLVGQITRQLYNGDKRKMIGAGIIYLALTTISFQVLYDRLDIVLSFLILLSINLALSQRWLLACLALWLGTSIKLFPIILFPVLMLYQFRTPRKKTGVLSAFGGSLIIAIAILVTTISLFGDWWGYMIEYHSHRGIQIESVYATIIMLVSYVGIDSTISHQYGAFQIANSFSPIMAALAIPLISLLLLAIYYAYYVRSNGRDKVNRGFLLFRGISAVLLSFIAFNKVLSPQFMLWLFPILSILAVSKHQSKIAIALLFVAAATTTLIFPYMYRSLVAQELAAVVILAVRNSCLIVILVQVIRQLLHAGARLDEAT
jgi:hypothetical protein